MTPAVDEDLNQTVELLQAYFTTTEVDLKVLMISCLFHQLCCGMPLLCTIKVIIVYGQMAERLGNWAVHLNVAGSIPSIAKMALSPWARHFTLLVWGGMSLYLL